MDDDEFGRFQTSIEIGRLEHTGKTGNPMVDAFLARRKAELDAEEAAARGGG